MLIPSRGPHPTLPRRARPSRIRGGSRVPAGLPEGTRVEGRLVLIPPGDSHKLRFDCRLAGGRSGLCWKEDLHRDFGCGVGPVTGAAGSDEMARSRWASPFPPQSRGPLDAHTIERPSPISRLSRPHTVHVPHTPPAVSRVGPSALRVAVPGRLPAVALAGWARATGVQAVEVVPGATTVLFEGVRGPRPADVAAERVVLRRGAGRGRTHRPRRSDLRRRRPRRRGRTLGHRAVGVADRLAGIELVSAFCGFAPGFAYLSGLPPELAVPRLETPRSEVPAGAVALADRWCGVYPTTSPGGWRLLGHTTATLWDVSSDRPALLAPGTRVRLVPT